MSQKFDTDVVIVATAIRTRFWQEFYDNLTKNKSSFHLVFVGHTRPDFPLPENFTYIYSELKPAACVEIAYRYAHENINARFIMHTADDFIMYPYYLDAMISGYDNLKKEYNDDLLMITQISIQVDGSYDFMALEQNGPVTGIGPFTTMENSKKIGTLDKRFSSVCWDMDRVYRFYSMGGIMRPLQENQVPAVRERPDGQNTQWNTYSKSDFELFRSLWDKVEEGTGKVATCEMIEGKNYFGENKFFFKRNCPIDEYTNEELK